MLLSPARSHSEQWKRMLVQQGAVDLLAGTPLATHAESEPGSFLAGTK